MCVLELSEQDRALLIPFVILKKYYKDMNGLTVAERMSQFGLREDRADVLVPALEIFNNVMCWADIDKIYVPKISVADGLIHSIYDNLQKNK